MALDFKNITKIIGPGGKEVSKITRTSDGVILWQPKSGIIIDNNGNVDKGGNYIYFGNNSAIGSYQHQQYDKDNYCLVLQAFSSGTLFADFDFTVMSDIGITVPVSGKKLKFDFWKLSQTNYTVNKINFYSIKDQNHNPNSDYFYTISTSTSTGYISDLSGLEINIPDNSYGVRMTFSLTRNSSYTYKFSYMKNVRLV